MKIAFGIFIWLLSLRGCGAVMPGEDVMVTETSITVQKNLPSQQQRAAQSSQSSLKIFTSTPSSQTLKTIISRHHSASSIRGDATPTEVSTMKPSRKHGLNSTPSATTSNNSILAQSKKSTEAMPETAEAQDKVTSLETTTVATQASSTTTKSISAPPMATSVSQSHDTRKPTTSLINTEETTHPSANPTQTTSFMSTKPVENRSTNQSPVPGGATTLYGTSHTMSPVTRPTTQKTTKDPLVPKPEKDTSKGIKHSDIVAGVIGGALVLMLVGFLVIFLKKQKFQKQQISTEWAGPSPFLDTTADVDQVALRSSNRISLSSFLPQRLSRRMQSLQEIDEMTEMTANTTFGVQYHEETTGPKGSDDHAEGSNVPVVAVSETKSSSASEPVENTASLNSSQSNELPSTNQHSQHEHLIKDDAANGSVENPAAQLKDGPEQT